MRTFVGQVPLSALAAVVAVIVAAALGPAVARRLGVARPVGMLLLFGFGLVMAATLVPTGAAMDGATSDGVCDFSRLGPASIRELTSVTFASLNVLLFVPLGVAVGLLPLSRPAVAAGLAAFSLTFVVEGIQLLVPALGRGCQTADMVDNLMGLVLGIAIGALARPLLANVARAYGKAPGARTGGSRDWWR